MVLFSAIAILKEKPPGTFIIRNSVSFPGKFTLVLKVAQSPPKVQNKISKLIALIWLMAEGYVDP